jgi:hypothetical protein
MFGKTAIRLRTVSSLMPVFRTVWRGYRHRELNFDSPKNGSLQTEHGNELFKYFCEHKEGRGIWKFNHYFDIYERHFSRFRGREVHLLEIGIYSGGSLEMWEKYFGAQARIYGVDIEPGCKAYEAGAVRVFTGDQADRAFWQRFKEEVPELDIVIDDGGHLAEQQIVSLEELLPHLRPGGVYLCEDVHHPFNQFSAYVSGLAQDLNTLAYEADLKNNERRSVSKSTALQSAVGGIHLYPYVTVLERTAQPVAEFVAPKRGTQWEPFLK